MDIARQIDLEQFEERQPPMSRAAAFDAVFSAKYVYSTFNDQRRAWDAAGLQTGEQERWIDYGRTSKGLWREFMHEWRQAGGSRRKQ